MLHRSAFRPLAAVLAVALLTAGSALLPGASGAQGSSEPSVATVLGARWLADQLTPAGYVEGLFAPGPDVDATRDVAFTLAATGLEEEAFGAAFGWITANIEEVIAPDDEPDGAGTLGVLVMLALAVGEDPRDLGGVDLVARLEATYGLYEDGLYGEADPTFDGVLRQSLALLGFEAAGVPYPDGATTWLENQQCLPGDSDPASEGGFPAYRNPAEPCPAPSADTYTGAEVDATAVAIQYFALDEPLGEVDAAVAEDALGFIEGARSASGGFPWYVGGDDSPNSTALAIGALVAMGEDATSSIGWLVDQQLGCDSPDAGAFTSSFSDGAADQFATRQAVLGVAGVSLPLDSTQWVTAADPCSDPSPGPGPGPGPLPGPTPADGAAVAAVTPRFTG
jgi:hypothetical protein